MTDGKARRNRLCPLTTSKRKRLVANKLAATVRQGFPPGLAQPALRALAAARLSSLDQLTEIREADLAQLHVPRRSICCTQL